MAPIHETASCCVRSAAKAQAVVPAAARTRGHWLESGWRFTNLAVGARKGNVRVGAPPPCPPSLRGRGGNGDRAANWDDMSGPVGNRRE